MVTSRPNKRDAKHADVLSSLSRGARSASSNNEVHGQKKAQVAKGHGRVLGVLCLISVQDGDAAGPVRHG